MFLHKFLLYFLFFIFWLPSENQRQKHQETQYKAYQTPEKQFTANMIGHFNTHLLITNRNIRNVIFRVYNTLALKVYDVEREVNVFVTNKNEKHREGKDNERDKQNDNFFRFSVHTITVLACSRQHQASKGFLCRFQHNSKPRKTD